MAAGNSRRFGSNKLLYQWKGKELYRYMLEALMEAAEELEMQRRQASENGSAENGPGVAGRDFRAGKQQDAGMNCFQVRVVTQYPEILEAVEKLQEEKARPSITGIFSPESAKGLSYTIRTTLAFEEEDPPDYFAFFTADTPELTKEEIRSFLEGFLLSGHGAGCMRTGDAYGNPAVFSWKHAPFFQRLTGDQGGKKVLNQLLSDCYFYDLPEGCRRDIDTPEDLI